MKTPKRAATVRELRDLIGRLTIKIQRLESDRDRAAASAEEWLAEAIRLRGLIDRKNGHLIPLTRALTDCQQTLKWLHGCGELIERDGRNIP